MDERTQKRPNVFPTSVKTSETNEQIPNSQNDPIGQSNQIPAGELAAAEEMRRRTEEQIRLRNHAIAQTNESKQAGIAAREELMREMEQKNPNPLPQDNQKEIVEGAMSYEEIARFQKYMEQVDEKKKQQQTMQPVQQPPVQQPPVVPPTHNYGQSAILPPEKPKNVYIEQLSQPQVNSAFDVIPLPSQGKLYKNKRKNIKLAYMSTADENILSSPNLLNSGEFLEILINRKMLDTDLRYRDLIEGDRNAIMLWLRATGYGHMYPVTLEDEDGKSFETEVNLNDIKTINLTVNPDINGHFTFKLPVSGLEVKFKLLTVGDVEDISEQIDYEIDVLKMPVDNTNTYTLAKQLVSINGDENPDVIQSFSQNMRIGDGVALKKYIDSINCGVDMQITVRTPRGGSINTFLPLNLKFFWPNFRI